MEKKFKIGDMVVVVEANTHSDYSRPFIGYTGEVCSAYSNAYSVTFGDRVVVLFDNEILPAKEHQVLQLLRKWKSDRQLS